MKTKQILNKLTYNNFRANVGMFLGVILILTLIAVKAFLMLKCIYEVTPEIDQMMERDKEIREKQEAIRDKI